MVKKSDLLRFGFAKEAREAVGESTSDSPSFTKGLISMVSPSLRPGTAAWSIKISSGDNRSSWNQMVRLMLFSGPDAVGGGTGEGSFMDGSLPGVGCLWAFVVILEVVEELCC